MANSPHFSDAELACPHCHVNGTKQSLVDALEQLRTLIGQPIKVHSAYRCEVHNLAVGGVPNSEHVEGIAADISVDGMSAGDIYVQALKVPSFAEGGIGVAPHQNYIHVDTRSQHARWAYDQAGKWCHWNLDLPLNA